MQLVQFKIQLFIYRPKQFCIDRHLSDMLVFHQRTDFHDHALYKSGQIILQVKYDIKAREKKGIK